MVKDKTAMWRTLLKMTLVVSCFTTNGVLGYSRGAPDTTCSSLNPGHGGSKVTSASPYTLTPSSSTVEGGSKILVTLKAPDTEPGFKGFLVQARNAEDETQIVGTFFTTDHSYLTCNTGFNNAVTHSSPTTKPKVALEWQAPSDFSGEVIFKATFVQTYDTYWVGVTSEKVTITPAVAAPPSAAPPAAAPPTTTTTTTTESAPVSETVDAPSFSPENAGDFVINVVDAPGVDVVVENDIGLDEAEEALSTPSFGIFSQTSSPSSIASSPTFSTAGSSSNISSSSTDSSLTDSGNDIGSNLTEFDTQDTTPSSGGRTPPRRRFGLFGKFKPTTTTTTTAKPAEEEVETIEEIETSSKPRVPLENLSPERASLQNKMQNIYLDCLVNKGCFGMPSGCETKENCEMLMTYTKVSSGFKFEIMGSTDSSGYVAAGLSEDEKMGDDSVMSCTSSNGNVDVVMGFNFVTKSNENLSNSKLGLSNIETAQVDGRVYCSFIRDTITEIRNINFDLSDERYHLMLATGPLTSDDNLGYHIKRTVTGSTSSLQEFESIQAVSELFVTLHACLMVGAWVCAASCGILLARYYKQTWLQNKCCGMDQWFHLHRFFMILTWSLTIAGFVLILYFKKWQWTDTPLSVNPHPLIGVLSIGLCFIQPFMAMCRCAPNHKNRAIFNWFHWFVGNSAHILGLTAIFYGLDLVAAPKWTWFILMAFIGFHCIVHLTLSIGQCVSDSKEDKSNNVFPMKEMNGSRNPLHPVDKRVDAPGGTFRKTMLALYLLVTWIITAVLILIIVFKEDQLREWGLFFWENMA